VLHIGLWSALNCGCHHAVQGGWVGQAAAMRELTGLLFPLRSSRRRLPPRHASALLALELEPISCLPSDFGGLRQAWLHSLLQYIKFSRWQLIGGSDQWVVRQQSERQGPTARPNANGDAGGTRVNCPPQWPDDQFRRSRGIARRSQYRTCTPPAKRKVLGRPSARQCRQPGRGRRLPRRPRAHPRLHGRCLARAQVSARSRARCVPAGGQPRNAATGAGRR
jgi:hypothetical protein